MSFQALFFGILQLLCMVLLPACRNEGIPVSDNDDDAIYSMRQHISDKSISPADLVKAIETRDIDATLKALGLIRKMSSPEPFLSVIKKYWDCQSNICSAEVRDFVGDPKVKLEFADCLIQAKKNRRLAGSSSEYADYVRQILKEGRPEIFERAVIILGIYSDPEDIHFFVRVLQQEDVKSFSGAVFAISYSCAMKVNDIQDLAERFHDKEMARYLMETWSALSFVRKSACSTYENICSKDMR